MAKSEKKVKKVVKSQHIIKPIKWAYIHKNESMDVACRKNLALTEIQILHIQIGNHK